MDSVGRDVRKWLRGLRLGKALAQANGGIRSLFRSTMEPDVSQPFWSSRFILDDTLSSSLLSDIQRVSRENGVPPTRISSSLDEISEDLARYDAEIARLAAHRQALHDLHEAGRSLWSPIRRLPVEVLTDIFRKIWLDFRDLCTAGDDLGIHYNSHSRELMLAAFAPLLELSRVSSTWHSIIMHTPQLWTDIWVVRAPGMGDDESVSTAVALLEVAVQRSRDAPLHLTLGNCRLFDKSFLDIRLLKVLTGLAHRWKTATLVCFWEDILHVAGGLPLLEHLDISVRNDDSPSAALRLLEGLRNSPRLKSLSLRGNLDASVLNLEDISLVQINYISLDQIHTVVGTYLPRLSGRVMLGLHLSAPPITLPTTYSRMTALGLALTSPISSHVSGTILAVILSSLTLPCVTSMEFEPNPYFKHQLLPWPHVAFIGVAQRSDFASHLRELHIRWIAIKDTELVEVLKALPGLETLGLGDDFPISTPVHPASSSSSSSSEDSSSDEDNSSSDEDNSSSDEDIDIAPRVIEPANPPLLSHMLLCRLSQLAEDTHELIPHLKIFNYASQMNFDHTEFLAFVSTRAIASIPRKGLEPFTVELEWLAPDKSALPPVDLDFHLNDHLQELVNRRKLRYSFRVCGPESW